MAKDDKEKKDDAKDKKEEAAKDEKSDAAKDGAEGEGDGEGGEAKPKKSKKKLFIIIGLVVVLLIGGGAAAYFTGMLGGGGHDEEKEVNKAAEVVYYTMPEMIINLSSPGKQASFLKANIILELPNKLDAIAVESNLPRLMDAFNTYVRELRPSDLSGSAGITRLREELLLRANKALEPTKINDVLFKQIMIQ